MALTTDTHTHLLYMTIRLKLGHNLWQSVLLSTYSGAKLAASLAPSSGYVEYYSNDFPTSTYQAENSSYLKYGIWKYKYTTLKYQLLKMIDWFFSKTRIHDVINIPITHISCTYIHLFYIKENKGCNIKLYTELSLKNNSVQHGS